MSDEQHTYEVDVIVRANGQPDATIHREMVSSKASTNDAAAELWECVGSDIKARMRPVNNGK